MLKRFFDQPLGFPSLLKPVETKLTRIVPTLVMFHRAGPKYTVTFENISKIRK